MHKKVGIVVLIVIFSAPLFWMASAPAAAAPVTAEATAVGHWELVLLPSTQSVYALDMLNATEGWAGGAAGFIFRFDGQWGGVPTSFDKVINAISIVDSNNAWGVTWQGNFIHWDGTDWTILPGTPDVGVLDDVLMLNADEGWAVGGGGTILRYGGGSWFEVPSPVGIQLKSIDMLDANDGWAVGLTGTIARWNGSTWTGGAIDTQGAGFYGVDIVSHDDVWAVGGGGMIYHYTAAGWQKVDSPTNQTLRSVAMISSDDGWAVGDEGVIIHYDGSTWELVPSPTSVSLSEVKAVSAYDVWAVGRVGVAVHYVPDPDLAPSALVVDKQTAAAGDILNYTLTVENVGAAPATSVVVSDTLDLGAVTVVTGSLTTSQGTPHEGNPLRVEVGDIAPGTTVTITFQVKLLDLGRPCWFVPNRAIIQGEGVYLVRSALTIIGTPYTTHLPIVLRGMTPPAY